MNIDAMIKSAKLGASRKDAQVDTCSVFAAALYDVLTTQGIPCQMITATQKGIWAHSVVEAAGRYFDSLGEFSATIYRARRKIHPKVAINIEYQIDHRPDCYEPEFDELYAFYAMALNKAVCDQVAAATV